MTVEIAIEMLTWRSAASLTARSSRTKAILPLNPIVRNAAIQTIAAAKSRTRRRSGMAGAPEQNPQENGSSDDTHDRADRNLVWKTDQPADDVAAEYQCRSACRDPGDRSAQIVTHHARNDIRNHKSDEWDHADHDDRQRRDDGNHDEAELQHASV